MKKTKCFSRIPVLLCLLAAAVVSCKSGKIVSEAKVKPMSAERIIRKMEDNAFDYRFFSIRRISCQFEDGDNRTTFRANLSTQKDKSVVVSFNKLNIPVGRIFLSPNDIKYVNHLEKTYLEGDYSILRKLFNIDLDFNDVQAIVGNNLFLLGGNNLKDLTVDIESGKYVLRSVKSRKISKLREADGKRGERIQKRFGAEVPVIQTIVVNPEDFNIEKIRMEDQSGGDWVEFNFGDYTAFRNKDYPGSIDLEFHSAGTNITMKLRLAGFSTDKPDEGRFKIPEKYEKMVIRQED